MTYICPIKFKMIMARLLTASEKKDLRAWAKNFGVSLSSNKKLEFGHGFWRGGDIDDLKEALLKLEDFASSRSKARLAVGPDYVPFVTVSYLGNKKGMDLIGYMGKEVYVRRENMINVNGYLAIPKSLLNA